MRLRLLAVFFLFAACGGTTTTAADCASPTADTWTGYGATFFATNCRGCHQHAGQYGTQASVQSALNQVDANISSGRMPQGGGLSATEQARVLTYLSCGAP